MSCRTIPRSVLVLDGEFEASLAVVRSLGRRNLRVHVGSRDACSLAGLSRFCRSHFRYPDPLQNLRGFTDFLLEYLAKNPLDLVVPVTDVTIVPLMGVRGLFPEKTVLAMASDQALEIAFSKIRTFEIASRLGIPTPRSATVHDMSETTEALRTFRYPLVVKPDRSRIWGSDGVGHRLTTVYVRSRLELEKTLSELLFHGPVLLQEFIHGESVGLGTLTTQGRLLFTFQFASFHEIPATGGTSTFRTSEKKEGILQEYAAALLNALSWDGVAHVEFQREKGTGALYLMEINGRFWASLPLAVASGADFPAFLWDLMVDGRRQFPAEYVEGVRARQLLGEWEWFKEAWFRADRVLDLVTLPHRRTVFREALGIFDLTARIDTFDREDLLPGLYDCWRLVRRAAGDLARKAGTRGV